LQSSEGVLLQNTQRCEKGCPISSFFISATICFKNAETEATVAMALPYLRASTNKPEISQPCKHALRFPFVS